MKEGDIVVVIDSKSLPSNFLGQYGKVTATSDVKVFVEFYATTKHKGGFSHSAYPSDLKKVGEVFK